VGALERRSGGLGVESTTLVVVASGAVGAGRPLSSMSMSSSLSEEVEGGQLASSGGGLRVRRRDWSSPAFPGEDIVVGTRIGTVGGEGRC